MRLGTNVVRTVDLLDIPAPPPVPPAPPDPALDPRVDQAFAAIRQELAAQRYQVGVLRQAIARLAHEVQHPDPDAAALLATVGLDPDAPEGDTGP